MGACVRYAAIRLMCDAGMGTCPWSASSWEGDASRCWRFLAKGVLACFISSPGVASPLPCRGEHIILMSIAVLPADSATLPGGSKCSDDDECRLRSPVSRPAMRAAQIKGRCPSAISPSHLNAHYPSHHDDSEQITSSSWPSPLVRCSPESLIKAVCADSSLRSMWARRTAVCRTLFWIQARSQRYRV